MAHVRSIPLLLTLVLSMAGTLSGGDDPPTATPTPGRQVAAETIVKLAGEDGSQHEATVRHLVFLPAGYDDDKNKQWPLMLFLHGSGERGDDLQLVKKHGPPKLVESRPDFPFVLVSPQCDKETRWKAAELAKLVEQAANTYRIDKRRLYVTGLSMGGSGTWSLLAASPGLFAAAAPMCGRGDLAAAERIARTPVWAFVGAKDREATVKANDDMNAALIKAAGNVKLTVYPDVPHDCWTVSYNNPELYKWLLAHPRTN